MSVRASRTLFRALLASMCLPRQLATSRYISHSNGDNTWPTPIVVVPAHFEEWRKTPPWQNKLPESASSYLYQRTSLNEPAHSPNFGFEGGVHLQFIVEHYENLPDIVVFTRSHPELDGSPSFFEWLKCIRLDGLTFTSFNDLYVENRGMLAWKKKKISCVVEQCWRDMLRLFNLDHMLPAGQAPFVSFYAGSQFSVSQKMIQRHSRQAYERAREILSSNQPCHRGDLNWTELSSWGGKGEAERDATRFHKDTSAAWEHLNHVILGGQPLLGPRRSTRNLCQSFHDKARCPGSPAGGTGAGSCHASLRQRVNAASKKAKTRKGPEIGPFGSLNRSSI